MRVINLYGGPGTGKSTTMAGLFHLLKLRGMLVEMAPEFAKELVWQKSSHVLGDQLFILATQNHKLWYLQDQVDWAITDCPLLLSTLYAPSDYYKAFKPLVYEMIAQYDNLHIFLKRVKVFNPKGRLQNEEQAKKLDIQLKTLLNEREIPFFEVVGDASAPQVILELIHSIR